MSNKLDRAISDALRQNILDLKNTESKGVQAAHLWERLRKEIQHGIESINADPQRVRLVGGRLEYEAVDGSGYLSNDTFRIKNEVIPCLVLKVNNCREYFAVELTRRFMLNHEVHEKELSVERLDLMIDKSSSLFTRTQSGQQVFDAETLAVELLSKFWNPAYRE